MNSSKIECVNPNTGSRMNIDADIYRLIAKGIQYALKENRSLTYTEMVEGIKSYLDKNGNGFSGSVSWYAVTVKNDMQVRGKLLVYTEKGKKLHKLPVRQKLN